MNSQQSIHCIKVTAISLASLCFGLGSAAQAASTSLISTADSGHGAWGDGGIPSCGYAFTLSSSVTLDQLGVYDMTNGEFATAVGAANDGLLTSHFVGLWSYDAATGATVLLASVTVPSGGAGTDVNGYIYATPTTGAGITLGSGTTYILGEELTDATATTGDHYSYGALSSANLADGVTVLWAGYPWAGVDGLVPIRGQSTVATSGFNAYIGPNLTFSTVPEPSTWAMIVGGVGLLAFGQRLRRYRA